MGVGASTGTTTTHEEATVSRPSHGLHRFEETHMQTLPNHEDDEPLIHQMNGRNSNQRGAIKEISTPFNGGKAQFGAMFDIRSLPNNIVRIDSLAFHTLDEVQRCNIQIFTKRGSFEFFEEESSAWKRIKSVTTVCRGPGRKTVISLSDGNFTDYNDFRINRSERRAFYIRSIETQVIYSVAEKQNAVVTEDDHVQIFTGVAVGQYFKDFWTPRMLNVAITYVVERIWSGQTTVEPGNFGQPIGKGVCTNKLDVMTKDGVNKNFGIMFNVKSNSERDLTVYGLGFYVDVSSSIEYEIYTMKGSFEHGSATLSLWTKVAQGEEPDANRGTLIMISENDFSPVKIKAGETYGFYITLQSENLQYHSTSVDLGSTYLQSKDLMVSVGAGVGSYPFAVDTIFHARRGLKGSILYGIDKECRPEVSVKYAFIVKYPKHKSSEEVFGEINATVEKIIKFFLRSDESIKSMKKSFDLDLYSVFSQHDSAPPAICMEITDNLSCDTIVTDMVFSYKDEGLDEGDLSHKILQHVNTVVNNLNSGALQVKYSGEEPLDTNMLITLAGVPNQVMSSDEVGYFQGITRGFLKQKEQGSIKVLSVQVQGQNLKNNRHLMESPKDINEKSYLIRVGQESGVIDIKTKVAGKHQPPSPGIDFDQLVEDSINAEDGSYREELSKGMQDNSGPGSSYFETVREVYAKPISLFPTKSPTLTYVEPKGTGMSSAISIAIIAFAALLTFGLVFGAFVYRKRLRDKSRFRKSIFDEDEDDPLFFDVWDAKRSNNNTTIIPPFGRAKSKHERSVVTTETGAMTEDTRAVMSRQMSSFRGMTIDSESARPKMPSDRSRRLASSAEINGAPRGMINHPMDNRRSNQGFVRRNSLGSNYVEHVPERRDYGRMYQSNPVIVGQNDLSYEDRIQQKFREGAPRNFDGVKSERIIRSNPMVVDINSDYEDRVLRKFQHERRPSYPEPINTSRHSADGHDERVGRGSDQDLIGIERERSRHSALSSEHDERIRKKYLGQNDGDVMRRSGDLSREPGIERQRSRQSAHSSEHEERIRRKFQGLHEEKERMRQNSGMDMQLQVIKRSDYSNEHNDERIRKNLEITNGEAIVSPRDIVVDGLERQRSRQSGLSSRQSGLSSRQSGLSSRQSGLSTGEHEERIRLKRQGLSDLNRSTDIPTSEDIEGNREWEIRKKNDDIEEVHQVEIPAHMRFERRPSEDGHGVDFMSESTASTLSTHFTRIKNKEGNQN